LDCALQANYCLIWVTKYLRKVLDSSVEVRLLEILKIIAENQGYQLLAARVHRGDHVTFLFRQSQRCVSLMWSLF
jgi:REP element-mobilizing transposase RayT